MNELGAAGIGAAGSIAGNLVQNYYQDIRDKKARQFQLKTMQMQNQFNSPSAMMARMSQAGINPNLIVGQPMEPASNGVTPAQGSRSANFDDVMAGATSAMSAIASLQQQREQTKILHEQARQLKNQNDAEENYGKTYGDITKVNGSPILNQDGSVTLPEVSVDHVKPRSSYEQSVYDRHQREFLEQKGISSNTSLTDEQRKLVIEQTRKEHEEYLISKERAAQAKEFVTKELAKMDLDSKQAEYAMISMLPDIITGLGLKNHVTFDENGIPISVNNYDKVISEIGNFINNTEVLSLVARLLSPIKVK